MSMRLRMVAEMEVSVVDFDTFVDEIVREVKEKVSELGQQILEAILKEYSERIVSKLCDEGVSFAHISGEETCKGDEGFVRRGLRSKRRRLNTELGEVKIELAQVKCKKCGKTFSPLLEVIGLKGWQRVQNGLKERWIDLATDLPYRRSERQAAGLTGVRVSKSQLNRWILEDDFSEVTFEIDMDRVKEIFADGTKIRKQDGKKEDMRLLLGVDRGGKVLPIGVWIGKDWDYIGKWLIEEYGEERFKGKVLLSDGETGIEKHLLFKEMEHQRCVWHAEKDLGFMLWRDGLTKEARDALGRQFKEILEIKPRGKLSEEEKEVLGRQLEESKKALSDLVKRLDERGLRTSAVYVERLSESIFTYVRLLLTSGEQVSRTTGYIERWIRELGRRIKKVGGSWTDKGALNLIKLLWKRVFDEEGLRQYWRKTLLLRGHCRIVLCGIRTAVLE